jgi:hypothetical protein
MGEKNPLREHTRGLDSLSVISGLGESAWVGLEMAHNLSAVNEHVYEALSQMAGTQFDTIGDLHKNLEDWAQNWSGGLTEKAIDKLQGHVAEQVVAGHLEHLGHQVQIVEHSNQPGLDLLVDGHPVNVKNVADMTSIYQHFQKYPDIPVVANSDIDGHIDAALHMDPTHGIDQLQALDGLNTDHTVILDSGLDHDAVVAQVHDASDAITGNIEFHIPLITLTLSSFREARLLSKNHTDIGTSLKNIGFDLAGTGVGGFAGAKVGAVLGTLVAPGPGSVIGGIVGSIAGALGGRFLSNNVKAEPLNEAKTVYEGALKTYELNLKSVDEDAKKNYDRILCAEASQLQELAGQERQRLIEVKDSLIKAQRDAYALGDKSLVQNLKAAHKAIQDEIAELNCQLKNVSFFSKHIWPSEHVVRLGIRKRQILSKLKDLGCGCRLIFAQPSSLTQENKTNLTFELLCAIGFDADVTEHLARYRELIDIDKSTIVTEVGVSKKHLADKRYNCFQIITTSLQQIKEWAEGELRPFTETFAESQQALMIEMRKLGIETNK